MEQQEQRTERPDPRNTAWAPPQRESRRAALVARIRAANAETLERLAEL